MCPTPPSGLNIFWMRKARSEIFQRGDRFDHSGLERERLSGSEEGRVLFACPSVKFDAGPCVQAASDFSTSNLSWK